MNVAVIGTGYVGLTTGTALAYLGHRVTCVDKDSAKLELLCKGKRPSRAGSVRIDGIGRKKPAALPSRTQDAVKDETVILVAVGTPQKSNGEANTQYAERLLLGKWPRAWKKAEFTA